jgi:all-trans-retinol dehydrogenase (NAD+)
MVQEKHGHIVSVSSSTGLVGLSQLTDYSASKFGVVGFNEVLNYEMTFGGHGGVHTTLVCPAFIGDSAMFEGCQMK